jgi:hypothetical protein
MNHLKQNNWRQAVNALLLLALLVGVFGPVTPAKASLPKDGNTNKPASAEVDKGTEAADWRLAGDMIGRNNVSDPLRDNGMTGDLFARDVQQIPRQWSSESLARMASLTIDVSVPDYTPGTVYIFGNQPELGNWDPGAVPMTQSGPVTWTITLDFAENTPLAFNFGRGSVETEETEIDGGTFVPARQVTVTNGIQSESYSAANWRDPIVVDHLPADGASNQPIDTAISVSWNQAMGVGTDFLVVGPDGPISGTFTYYVNTYTYVFTPSALLGVGATYTVTAAGQTDADGDSQQVPVQFNFDTMVPTSVELVTLAEKTTMAESWWWVSWPWLMVLLTAVSMAGFVWTKRRRMAKQ